MEEKEEFFQKTILRAWEQGGDFEREKAGGPFNLQKKEGSQQTMQRRQ